MTTTFPVDNRNILNEADATTGWTATDGPTVFTADPSPVESTGYLGMQVSSTNEDAYTAITSDNYSQGGTLSIWMSERAALDTTANVGFGIVLGDGTDRVAFSKGSDTVTGFRHDTGPVKWACFLLDPANLPTDTVVLAGVEANLNLTAITQVGVYFSTVVKSVGGADNCFWDIIRWADPGDDVVMQGGTTAGAAGNGAEAAAVDRSTGNQQAYGVIRELGVGVYGIQGNLTIGNSASAANQFWEDTNATYAFEERELSDRNYYRLNLVGSSTATNCEFSFDGSTFVVPSGVGLDAAGRFDGNGADITVCNITGCTFIGWNVGVVTSDDTGDDWTNATFIGCGSVWAKGCDLTGGTFSETVKCALIEAQDETNYDDTGTEGGFIGGNAYAVNDTITLDNGALITVDAVSGGVVTQFTVTTSAGFPAHSGHLLVQASTSGTGIAFRLWPRSSSNLAEGGSIYYDLAVDPDGELDDLTFTEGATHDTHAAVFGPNIPSEITLRGWTTSGYSASNNVATSTLHFLDTTGTITVNVIGGTGNFSYKTEGAIINLVISPITVAINVKNLSGLDIEDARVQLEAGEKVTSGRPFRDSVSITRSGSTASVSHTAHGLVNGDKVVIRHADQQEYNGNKTISNVSTNAYDFTVSGTPTTPATSSYDHLINQQDETSYNNSPTTEGTFSSGDLYAVGEIITLEKGIKVVVDNNEANDVIDAQTEGSYDNSPATEGTFNGGTGHATLDAITLDNGVVVNVISVVVGAVTAFSVDSSGQTSNAERLQSLNQVSTTGSGTGFTLTPDSDNLTSNPGAYPASISEFTVDSGGQLRRESVVSGTALKQESTTGSGTGFTITPDTDNIDADFIGSTYVLIAGLTDANGDISKTDSYAVDQLITGWARKSTTSPLYKQSAISFTLDSTLGNTVNATLLDDE